jgi:hypothetical protein
MAAAMPCRPIALTSEAAIEQEKVPGIAAHYKRGLPAKSTRLHLEHSDGGLKVYSVNARGMACAGAT